MIQCGGVFSILSIIYYNLSNAALEAEKNIFFEKTEFFKDK